MTEGPERGAYAKSENLKGKGAEMFDMLYGLETKPDQLSEVEAEQLTRLNFVREQMADNLRSSGTWQRLEKRINDTIADPAFPITSDYEAPEALLGRAMSITDAEYRQLKLKRATWKLADADQDAEFLITNLDDYKPLIYSYVEMASLRLMVEIQKAQGVPVDAEVEDAVRGESWEWKMSDDQKRRAAGVGGQERTEEARGDRGEAGDGATPPPDNGERSEGEGREGEIGEVVRDIEAAIHELGIAEDINLNTKRGLLDPKNGKLAVPLDRLRALLNSEVRTKKLTEDERKEALIWFEDIFAKAANDLLDTYVNKEKPDNPVRDVLAWGYKEIVQTRFAHDFVTQTADLYWDMLNLDENEDIVSVANPDNRPERESIGAVLAKRGLMSADWRVWDDSGPDVQKHKWVCNPARMAELADLLAGIAGTSGIPVKPEELHGILAENPTPRINRIATELVAKLISEGRWPLPLRDSHGNILPEGQQPKLPKFATGGLIADLGWIALCRNTGILSATSTAQVDRDGNEVGRASALQHSAQAKLRLGLLTYLDRDFGNKEEPTGEEDYPSRFRGLALKFRDPFKRNRPGFSRVEVVGKMEKLYPNVRLPYILNKADQVDVAFYDDNGEVVKAKGESFFKAVRRGRRLANFSGRSTPPNLLVELTNYHDLHFTKGLSFKGETAREMKPVFAKGAEAILAYSEMLELGDREVQRWTGLASDVRVLEANARKLVYASIPGLVVDEFVNNGRVLFDRNEAVLFDAAVAATLADNNRLPHGLLGHVWDDLPDFNAWSGSVNAPVRGAESDEVYNARLEAAFRNYIQDYLDRMTNNPDSDAGNIQRMGVERRTLLDMATVRIGRGRVKRAIDYRINRDAAGFPIKDGKYELVLKAESKGTTSLKENLEMQIKWELMRQFAIERASELPVDIFTLKDLEVVKNSLTPESLSQPGWAKQAKPWVIEAVDGFDRFLKAGVWNGLGLDVHSAAELQALRDAASEFSGVWYAFMTRWDSDKTSTFDADEAAVLVYGLTSDLSGSPKLAEADFNGNTVTIPFIAAPTLPVGGSKDQIDQWFNNGDVRLQQWTQGRRVDNWADWIVLTAKETLPQDLNKTALINIMFQGNVGEMFRDMMGHNAVGNDIGIFSTAIVVAEKAMGPMFGPDVVKIKVNGADKTIRRPSLSKWPKMVTVEVVKQELAKERQTTRFFRDESKI